MSAFPSYVTGIPINAYELTVLRATTNYEVLIQRTGMGWVCDTIGIAEDKSVCRG